MSPFFIIAMFSAFHVSRSTAQLYPKERERETSTYQPTNRATDPPSSSCSSPYHFRRRSGVPAHISVGISQAGRLLGCVRLCMGVGPIQSRAYITKAYPSSPFPYSLILYVYDACDAVSAQGSGTRKKEKKKGKRAAGQWLKDGLLHSCHFISFHFTGLDLQLFFFSFFSFREENSQRFAIRIAFYLSFFFFPFLPIH